MPLTQLNPGTALVAIDLQQGIVGLPVTPHSAETVVANTARLAQKFREIGAPVIFVRISHEPDAGTALAPRVDEPAGPPKADPEFAELVDGLDRQRGDLVVTKRQWGAFHGTELDTQLRRRGITDVVLTGIATNIGVESTARQSYEHGYHTVVVSDAISGLSEDDHAFAVNRIFPKISQVDSTDAVLAHVAKLAPAGSA
jgi:nicotinamidase-related amidase